MKQQTHESPGLWYWVLLAALAAISAFFMYGTNLNEAWPV